MSTKNLKDRPAHAGIGLRLVHASKLLIPTSQARDMDNVAAFHLAPRSHCILVGVLAHHAAIFVTGYLAVTHEHFEDFASSIQNFVYMGTAMVVAMYIFFGSASVLFTTFAIAMFFTMARIDYEATHEIMHQDDE